jgi:4-hydroxy-tetrahydrodipicolinate synthase
MFQGVFTALVTPFAGHQLAEEVLRELVERQIKAGIHGLVVCGTTGEAAAMDLDEQLTAVRIVKEQNADRVPVIAGTGTNSTRASCELTQKMAHLGVDAALVVTPYYVKPPQRGLLQHYQKLAEIGLPLVAYNVPSRTGVSFAPETVAKLAGIKNVVAIKEASGDLAYGAKVIRACAGRLSVLSGDDATFLPLAFIGGQGCISVTSNVVPNEMVCLYEWVQKQKVQKAQALNQTLQPLMQALFTESNPIPVKAALAMLGLMSWEIRTPLAPLAKEHRLFLEQVLEDLKKRGMNL